MVLQFACETAVKQGGMLVDTAAILEPAEASGISQEDVYRTLEVSAEFGLIDVYAEETVSGKITAFAISPITFAKYARETIPDYDSLLKDVKMAIKEGKTNSHDISSRLRKPHWIIVQILELLKRDKLVDGITNVGGDFVVTNVKRRLKRE